MAPFIMGHGAFGAFVVRYVHGVFGAFVVRSRLST